jgi:hypothetical protein
MRPAAEWETCGRAERRGRETRAERRSRSPAPRTAASAGDIPSRQSRAAKVIKKTELDTETPMLMIVPMNDSMFSVVPVANSSTATPRGGVPACCSALSICRDAHPPLRYWR